MFASWGRFVYRHRRVVVIVTIALALASLTLASKTAGALSAGGWLDSSSESAAVSERLDQEFGAGRSSVIVLFRSTSPGADARSAEFQERRTDSPALIIIGPLDCACENWRRSLRQLCRRICLVPSVSITTLV